MYFIIFLLFFNNLFSFISLPLNILLLSKESLIKKLRLIEDEYTHFIGFIHEFHHILGSKILSNNYKNINNTYIIAQNKIFPEISIIAPAAYNIKFDKENYIQYEYQDKTKLILLKLRMFLSGYAAEEAFKSKSILLSYFVKDYSFVNTKSIFTLLINNVYLKNIISDINALFIYEKDIDYNDSQIKNYIDQYNNKFVNKTNILILEKIYPQIRTEFFKILYIIYEELIAEYSSHKHQKRFYAMITKNPSLLANEIFFFNDLKSLWENQKLYREISNIKSYNHTEKIIIKSLINKKIHPFEQIEELKKQQRTIFKINMLSEKIYYYTKRITKIIKKLCPHFHS
jgi:hypothetical protein